MKITFTDGTYTHINFIKCIADVYKNMTCPVSLDICKNLEIENEYMKKLLAGWKLFAFRNFFLYQYYNNFYIYACTYVCVCVCVCVLMYIHIYIKD